MKWFFTRKIKTGDTLFNGHYVDVKVFYVLQFDKVPCVGFVGEIDIVQAYYFIKEKLERQIVDAFQHAYLDHDKQDIFFNNNVFVLTGNRMIEIARGYVQILHTTNDYAWANELMKALGAFKVQPPAYQTQIVGFARQPEMN